jgi:hypothetical protein
MPILPITIETPAVGGQGQPFDGLPSTDEERAQEQAARDDVLKVLLRYLQSLPQRPPRRSENVSAFDLLGGNALNKYLLLLTVDIGFGQVSARELSELLPEGSRVSALGDFDHIASSEHAQT